jgi:GNAT superfamily N-acetyltransferase
MARDLRLVALKDPASSVAFVGTFHEEAAFPEEVWRRRACTPSFIAETESGEWVANVTVLVETGEEFAVPQTHLVAVYVRPEHRGNGLADELLRKAIEWSWELPEKVDRVRLWVHENNPRAQALYGRLGFSPSGRTGDFRSGVPQSEYEMVLPRP